MMVLGFLFLLLLLTGAIGHVLGRGRFSWRAHLAHGVIGAIVVVSGYAIALCDQTSDTELWSGTIAQKKRENSSCCHSYECNCRERCTGTGSGPGRSCSTTCDTCYEHAHDVTWTATTSNGEEVFRDRCNPPGSDPPDRWQAIRVGEPTAVEHTFTNYIKASPDSILRRTGALEKFERDVPPYPRVYDAYRVSRFIVLGVPIPDVAALNRRLSELNADVGAERQVDVIVVVTRIRDPQYAEALREAWIGGKKNDFIVVIGAPDYPQIGWVGVVSWTKSEDLKVSVRDRILALPRLDETAIDVIGDEVRHKFRRRHMSDFTYLSDEIEISDLAIGLIATLQVIVGVLTYAVFWRATGARSRSRTSALPRRW